MTKQKYGKVEVEITNEKAKEVFKLLMKFYNKHKLYDGEMINQDDEGTIESPIVLSDIADFLFKDIEIDYE